MGKRIEEGPARGPTKANTDKRVPNPFSKRRRHHSVFLKLKGPMRKAEYDIS